MRNVFTLLLSVAVAISCRGIAQAHFPWMIENQDGKIALFFGEDPTDQTYKMPKTLLSAKVYALGGSDSATVKMNAVDSKDFVGLVAASPAKRNGLFSTKVTYGVYHGNLLQYRASYYRGKLPAAADKFVSAARYDDPLSAVVVDTDSGVDVFVTWQGKPLKGTEVKLFCDEGHEEGSGETDAEGKISFTDRQVEDGLNAIMLGHTVEGESGDLDGEAYQSTMFYQTLTFTDPESVTDSESNSKYADLPFEITSFGAARVGDHAFVYGGHTGNAHSYSTEEQSNQLLGLNLSDPAADWKEIATGERLQGLAMVPHTSSVILLGGFTAKNAAGEDHDLHSLSAVRKYDLEANKWMDLPPLPEGRSSHDAAILDGTIYVVGGWKMAGEEETQWHSTAYKLDLGKTDAKWEAIAEPPFVRRALAVVAHAGKIFVIGGMDQDAGPTKDVQVYDPKKNAWQAGPELVGDGRMAGFGAAAWSVGGNLLVSTYEGKVLQLDESGDSWKQLGASETSRFFHRLIPIDDRSVVSVGGANMEEGKYLELEVINAK